MEDNALATHYALLIGICFTPKERRKEWAPLNGCTRDVQEIEQQLAKSSRADIRILTASLTDPDASSPSEDEGDLPTHNNIVSSLEKITLKASTGNFIYIHFSGHGTAIEPTSPFANHYTGELALVVIASDDATKIQYLRGSELAYQLEKMVEKGLKVTLVLDCCASGSVVRDKINPSARYLPYSLAVDIAYPPIPGQSLGFGNKVLSPVFRSASMLPNWLVNPDGYTILTACGPTEIAQELLVEGKYHGALSYFLVRAFDRLGRVGGKLQHLYAHLCTRFGEGKLSHRPMLYGNKNLYFFEDVKYGDDTTAVPVINKNGKLILETGQAHGICEGDIFALSSRGLTESDSREGHPVLTKVIHVGALTSVLRLLDNTPISLASGMTATVRTRLSLRNFPVWLEFRLPCSNIWETALQKRPSLDIHYTGNEEDSVSFKFHVILHSKHCYEIRDESNHMIPDLPAFYDLDEDENPDYVLDIVHHLVKFKMVENLANSSPANSFLESFSVQVVDAAGTIFCPGCRQFGPFHTGCSHQECLIKVKDGNELELIVQNKAKEDGRQLHFHLYSLGSCWEVENLLSAEGEEIPPRCSNQDDRDFELGTTGEWKKKITMTVPKGQHQCDIFKIFLTSKPTSFMSLELPEVGQLTKRYKGKEKRGENFDNLSEDWVALNFRIRTDIVDNHAHNWVGPS